MKIIFKEATLQHTISIIKHFYYSEEKEVHPTNKYLYGYYPELKNIDSSLSKEEKDKLIYRIVEKKYNEELPKIKDKVIHFTKVWDEFNDSFINTLSEYLNTSWPTNKDEIIGYIAPVPIFPRNIEELYFIFSPNITDKKMIEVVAHECTHFLWFKKTNELYKKKYDEYSNSEWEYSELVVDPILNSPELNNVLHINEKAYDYFYEQELNGEKIMDHITNIYRNNNESIESKIDKGYKYYLEFLESKSRV